LNLNVKSKAEQEAPAAAKGDEAAQPAGDKGFKARPKARHTK